jgi:alpha-beta hydrolase superfamily lysophospholipase
MTTISFGSRATVSTLIARLEDATVGNKDGIVGNEAKKTGDASGASVFDTNPLLFQLRGFFSVGLSKKDEQTRLSDFLGAVEKQFGPVTTEKKPAWVKQSDWNTYVVDKAITMVRLGRAPGDCVDGFVKARGSVDGHAIAPRDVFTQTWKPSEGVKPSGKTVVISPGFLESGRNYTEQIQLLNKQGHEVVVMDHQWAGLTGDPTKGDNGGAKGHIDRGFGIARDVAAVAAHLASQGKDVTIAGTSMGGGAGAVGAWVMNDQDKIQLEGPRMPKGLSVLGLGAFFDRTGGVLNGALAASGKIPGLNQFPLPATGAPILSGDQATLRMIAAHASTEHLTGQAQAFHASTEDLATVKKLLASGVKPQGKIELIHSKNDTLANPAAAEEWAKLLGANLHLVDSTSHVYSESPTEMKLVLGGLERLGL